LCILRIAPVGGTARRSTPVARRNVSRGGSRQALDVEVCLRNLIAACEI
jgi:hypothetical protein